MEDYSVTNKPLIQVILLADDDEDDVFLFQEALDSKREEVNIKVANNGFQALSSLEEMPKTDIIFMDVNMPLMDGIECLTRIRKLYKNVPVIILTTSSNEGLILQSKALGASGFISKPLTFSRYKDVMKDVMSIDWTKNYPLFYLSIK